MIGVKFKTKPDPNSALGKHLDIIKNKPITYIEGAYGGLEGCVGIVEEIKRPEEGGIFTKLVGCSFLYKGYPDADVLERLEISKDVSWLFFRFFNTWVGRIILLGLVILPKRLIRKFVIKWAEEYLHIAHTVLRRNVLDARHYCPAIREFRKALHAVIQDIPDEELANIAGKLLNIAVMILEYDAAYKLRFQDVIPEVNMHLLRKDPINELKRLFDILCERELNRGMRDKWRRIETKLLFILRISAQARKVIIKFFEELDMERVKLDQADWYFCLKRKLYNYKGVSLEDRLLEKKKIDKELNHDIPRVSMMRQGNQQLLQIE